MIIYIAIYQYTNNRIMDQSFNKHIANNEKGNDKLFWEKEWERVKDSYTKGLNEGVVGSVGNVRGESVGNVRGGSGNWDDSSK
jgi:hypothetical protein